MKLTKKKVVATATAVSMIAILSMGTLAWFNADDEVTNEFLVAGSDDGADGIFSVDVWEDLDNDGEKDEGIGQFPNILPGDELPKIVHVENTGSYDQYIRVRIEVSNAPVWQDVYEANMVPVTEFVDVELDKLYGIGSYLEGESFVYYLYYNDILEDEDTDDMIVFNKVHISERLTREQAAALTDGKFSITIKADAVQTENVGNNVYEAFQTVGMEIPVNTVWVDTEDELLDAFQKDDSFVVMGADITLNEADVTIEKEVNLYLGEYILKTLRKNFTEANKVYGLKVETSGKLTIGGHGTLYMPGDRGIYVNGTLDIYGGNYLDDYNRGGNDDEALINVYENGTLNIYNGTFNGADYCVYKRNGNGVISILGGTYYVEGNKTPIMD